MLVLMAGACFFGVLALATAACCCHKCGCCQATVVLWSALFAVAAVIVYVVYTEQGKQPPTVAGITLDFSAITPDSVS